MLNLLSFFGIFGLCFVAWLGSEDRRLVPWKVIFWGITLQLLIGLMVFTLPFTRDRIVNLNDIVNAIIDASDAGSRFLFGPIFVPDASRTVGPSGAGRWIARSLSPAFIPVAGDRIGADNLNMGYIFAFRSLPQIIFFSALLSLIYRLGLLQPIVQFFARIFQRTMNLSGAESLSGAANIFVGIEAVIAVKPFLANMTRSELCAILASCFGSIASTVLALYAGFLRPVFPTITGHLMSASILTIPASFVIAKLLVPEKEVPETLGHVPEDKEDPELMGQSPMDALIGGAMDGVKMAVGIAAVLVAIVGLVALLNLVFAYLGGFAESPVAWLRPIGQLFSVITLQSIMGAIFLPLTFLTGVSLEWNELWQASVIIGRRFLETAIPPYTELAALAARGEINERTLVVVSYALCGFAHVPSLGIFVGGLAGLIPSRRKDISELGWKALWAGTLATLMAGAVSGVFFREGSSLLS
jgi:concentrative nucleoside transporter, CNT family